jgi:hypothetical protein
MSRPARVLIVLLLSCLPGMSLAAGNAVSRHLACLQHIQSAERLLDQGQSASALAELNKALALEVPHTYLRQLRLPGTGAAAHYLMACGHGMMGHVERSLWELEQAFFNGFTNRALALHDPRLGAIQAHPRFAQITSRASGAAAPDRFGGKTIASKESATELILQRKNNFPKLGEPAPEIALERSDGAGLWTLSSFRGSRPVVLVFGSFT